MDVQPDSSRPKKDGETSSRMLTLPKHSIYITHSSAHVLWPQVPWKVPGTPTAIENITLRYIKRQADSWCSWVGVHSRILRRLTNLITELHIVTASVSAKDKTNHIFDDVDTRCLIWMVSNTTLQIRRIYRDNFVGGYQHPDDCGDAIGCHFQLT